MEDLITNINNPNGSINQHNIIGLMFILITAIGGAISIVFLDIFITTKKEDSKNEPTESPVDKYLRETIDRFNYVKNSSISNTGVPLNTWILENTPIATIIMGYSEEKKSFIYYSDKKGIAFNILDAVCRKFCIRCKCFDIHVEMEVKERDIQRSNKLKQKGNVAQYKNDANFNKVISKKMNNFLCVGAIREFSFLQNYSKHKIQPHTTISFAEFKNKFKNNNL